MLQREREKERERERERMSDGSVTVEEVEKGAKKKICGTDPVNVDL